ncbi:type II secretion system protein [Burkholderia pyrrocinia]|uniref:prepilin-type N-terminal cleavage/methylation domain-containing protein n=1 Tax=Burkholderia cenocepacia TaxID=95486 RepID=UPI00158D69DA|nr:type II secretion system protein [Burkholderia cenocepacia]EKS9886926.1 type II secretion system protein [Burkholderia pyrrocinia]EKS9895881.1 type II secretion system protein [Burkholderia pyrrocinia]EKS9908554.1 type II secretion system protein [Burkholderia pyrrocinia]
MRNRYRRCAPARDRSRGFTLVEVLVALTLLALLASVALPFTDLVQRRGKEAELRQALITIRTAIDTYKQASDDGRVEKTVDASGYPPDLNALVDGVVDRKNPNGDMIYFLRRLPADPLCECSGKAAADTWETRSYSSSPDAFASGKDVFDIRSKSERKGINGIPYSQW